MPYNIYKGDALNMFSHPTGPKPSSWNEERQEGNSDERLTRRKFDEQSNPKMSLSFDSSLDITTVNNFQAKKFANTDTASAFVIDDKPRWGVNLSKDMIIAERDLEKRLQAMKISNENGGSESTEKMIEIQINASRGEFSNGADAYGQTVPYGSSFPGANSGNKVTSENLLPHTEHVLNLGAFLGWPSKAPAMNPSHFAARSDHMEYEGHTGIWANLDPNVYLRNIILAILGEKQLWPIRILAPITKADVDGEFILDTLLFHDFIAPRLPYEAPPRLISREARTTRSGTVRYGLGAQMEAGFYKTKAGQDIWALGMVQIVQAFQMTCMLNAEALPLAQASRVKLLYKDRYQTTAQLDKDMSENVREFGCIQKYKDGFWDLTKDMTNQLTRVDTRLQGHKDLMFITGQSIFDFLVREPSRREIQRQKDPTSGPDDESTIRIPGATIYKTRLYKSGPSRLQTPINLYEIPIQIGEFAVMGKNRPASVSHYRAGSNTKDCAFRNIDLDTRIFNTATGSFEQHSYAENLSRYSNFFKKNESPGPRELDVIGVQHFANLSDKPADYHKFDLHTVRGKHGGLDLNEVTVKYNSYIAGHINKLRAHLEQNNKEEKNKTELDPGVKTATTAAIATERARLNSLGKLDYRIVAQCMHSVDSYFRAHHPDAEIQLASMAKQMLSDGDAKVPSKCVDAITRIARMQHSLMENAPAPVTVPSPEEKLMALFKEIYFIDSSFIDACLKHDIYLDIKIVIGTPFITYLAESAILCVGGGETAQTLINSANCTNSFNGKTKIHNLAFSARAGVVCIRPEYIVRRDAVFIKGYLGGNNREYFDYDLDGPRLRDGETTDEGRNPSNFCLVMYAGDDFAHDTWYSNLSGTHPQLARDSEVPLYGTAAIYCKAYNFKGDEQRPMGNALEMEVPMTPFMALNYTVCQTHQINLEYHYGTGERTWSQHVTGRGHRGDNMSAQMAAVYRGEVGSVISQVDYDKVRFETLRF